MDKLIEELKEIRKVARRMHKSWLETSGYMAIIEANVPELDFPKFNIRERIDTIILGGIANLPVCHCGNYCKPGRKFCSPKCTGNDPEYLKRISILQKSNSKERMMKSRETMLEKYGVPHNNLIPACIESRKEKRDVWAKEERRKTFLRYGVDINDYDTNEKVQALIDNHVSLNGVSLTLGGMPIMTIHRYLSNFDVKLYEKQSSGAEREIREYINSLGFNTECSDRTLIKPYEVDIIIHEKKLCIEFDGCYWHSSKATVNKNHHKMKTDMCNAAGYQLLHIFEDEWMYKCDIVKSIIKSKLGITERIHARKTSVGFITRAEAYDFFERTHIQGNANAKYFVALRDEYGHILSCISIGKPRFSDEAEFELIRFATELGLTVVGGFGKMLKFFRSNHTGKILTYCDLRYSTGKTYGMFGVELRETDIGYYWVKGVNRITRYATMKSKLEKLVPAFYDASKTELEIMEAAGYARIYDCGNKVFIL